MPQHRVDIVNACGDYSLHVPLAENAVAENVRMHLPILGGEILARREPAATPPATAEFSQVTDANPPALSRLLAPGAALLIISLLGLLVVGRLGRRTTP